MDLFYDFVEMIVFGCLISFAMVMFKRLIGSERDKIG